MGHVINPISFRLGKIFFWDFIWSVYTKKNFRYLLIQDISISNFLIWFFNLKKFYKIGFILGFFKILRLHKKIYILLYLYNSKLSYKFKYLKKTYKQRHIKNFKLNKKLSLFFKFETKNRYRYYLFNNNFFKYLKKIKFKKLILRKIKYLKKDFKKLKWFKLPLKIKILNKKKKYKSNTTNLYKNDLVKLKPLISINIRKTNKLKNKKFKSKNLKHNKFNKNKDFFSIDNSLKNILKKFNKASYNKLYENQFQDICNLNSTIFYIYKFKNKIFIREVFNPKFIKKNVFFFINFGLNTSRIKIIKKKIIKFLFLYDFFFKRKKYKKILFLKKIKLKIEYKKIMFLKKCIYFLNYLFHFFIFYYFSKILTKIIKNSLLFKKLKLIFIFYNFYKLLNNAKMISMYCSKMLTKELAEKETLSYVMYPIIKKLSMKKGLRGFKFLYTGRITRKQRAMFKWEKRGIVSLSTKKIPVEFNSNIFFTQYGICSLKVWIVRDYSNIKFLKHSMFFSFY